MTGENELRYQDAIGRLNNLGDLALEQNVLLLIDHLVFLKHLILREEIIFFFIGFRAENLFAKSHLLLELKQLLALSRVVCKSLAVGALEFLKESESLPLLVQQFLDLLALLWLDFVKSLF